MENEKTPLYVAFSTQKGGVGKTTFTVLAASYLYYLKGYDVAVVDCDYPQHSIAGMRKRDAEQVGADEDYKRMAYEQFTRLGKKAYPVLCSSPEKAIATADEHIAAGHVPDIVFFDLPGTVNSEGVINSLAGMDYIFTPISADKVVLESSLSFAMAIQKLLVRNEACRELHKDEEDAEYMFQDWENVPEGLIDESWISENFFALRDAVEDLSDTEQEAFFVWCNYKSHDLGEEDADDLVRDFRDEYQGEYDDEEDFAYEIIEECYDLPEFAKTYFDYKQFARDLFMCDYWFDDGFVFRAASDHTGGERRHRERGSD